MCRETEKPLIRVELGCGKKKASGYIGVDRFPLPGVDIVADLNERFPFDNEYVDVILAQHSLEHLDDLNHVMSEIYRVCKDGAIVFILSPYSNQSGNRANHYHKLIFNEHTFRFFSNEADNPYVGADDLYIPHLITYGLGRTDNSDMNMEFHQVGMEFFYYKQYRFLTEEQKRHARQAFQNVCDQIFYTLVVDKTGKMTAERISKIAEKAKTMEPPFVAELRARDKHMESGSSILDDIEEMNAKRVEDYGQYVEARLADVERRLSEIADYLTALEESGSRRHGKLFGKSKGQSPLLPALQHDTIEQQSVRLTLEVLEEVNANAVPNHEVWIDYLEIDGKQDMYALFSECEQEGFEYRSAVKYGYANDVITCVGGAGSHISFTIHKCGRKVGIGFWKQRLSGKVQLTATKGNAVIMNQVIDLFSDKAEQYESVSLSPDRMRSKTG